MSKWGKLTLTNQGIALLAKCQTRGIQLLLTNVKLGDGLHDNDLVLEDISALVSEKQTISIDSKSVVDDTTCKILCNISNSGLANGYYLREIGLYASDPDVGEILYMVNYDSVPDYLPGRDEGSPVEQEFVIYATVTNADNVRVEVDYERSYRKEDTYSKDEVDSEVALLQNGLAAKANASDVYTKANVYTKTEADNRYLKTSGGTLTNRLTINRANNTANGAGLLFSGNNQSFAIGVSDTTVTKGVAPTSEKYLGIDFYGKDLEQNNRMGMIEYSINSNNVSTMSLTAFSCVTNTASKKSTISCSIDSNGNEYTSAPTPATTDNSTKIATTAYVKSNLANYLPLSGGALNGAEIKRNVANGTLAIIGGNGSDSAPNGAKITLAGADLPSFGGQFWLQASDGANSVQLVGYPSGSLTWNGYHIPTTTHVANSLDQLKEIFYKLKDRESQSGSYNTINIGTTSTWGVFFACKWNETNGSILLMSNNASWGSAILRYQNGSWVMRMISEVSV